MKIEVDRAKCQAYAVCVQAAEEVFDINDQDELVVLRSEVNDMDDLHDLVKRVQLAGRSCPMNAIQITSPPREVQP